MLPTTDTRRPWLPWLLVASLVASLALVVQLAHTPQGLIGLPLFDYGAFWAAGRLNAQGENPYDLARLQALEREANPATVDVLFTWEPPWAFTLLAPFVRLGPQAGHLLWQLVQLGILLGAVEILWRYQGGDPQQRWLAWLLTFTFLPCYFLLVTGQFGAIVLLGFAGFLCCLRQGRPMAAGAFLALAAVKPHLTFLFWIALLLWVVEGRHWRVALGSIVAVLVLLVLPLWENPHLPAQYRDAMLHRTQTHSHLSPVAGTALRLLLAPRSFGLQFVPLFPGVLWLLWYWQRHRRAWNWNERLPALLFASLLAAPYGAWPFDLVILLLPLTGRTVRLPELPPRRLAVIVSCYLLINVAALALTLREVEYFWFLWMTPALAIQTFSEALPSFKPQSSDGALAIAPTSENLAAGG